MRIKVTEENILNYGLDVITGNHRIDLLARAREAEVSGLELFVKIPDVMGGTTEEPTERNTFEHYSGIPEPDGFSHEQESTNLALEDYLNDPCYYNPVIQIDGSYILMCAKHGVGSKHAIDKDSHAPCLIIDPGEK